jgi:hypothetical protein
MSQGRVIRQLQKKDGVDKLEIVMVIEEEELGEDRSIDNGIIPETSEIGQRLWKHAQQEGRTLPFSPAAFGQPAGIQTTRLNAYTKAAREVRGTPIPKGHCVVSLDGFSIILPEQDLVIPKT